MKIKNQLCILIVIFILPQFLFSQEITTVNQQNPVGRIYHSLVYYNKSNCLILFPGFVHHGWSKDLITNDLWTFNLNDNLWSFRGLCFSDTSENRPGITTLTYDKESDRFITFDNDGRTWSFDLENASWTNMNPEISPTARCGQGMVYDEESDRVIMFGGFGCKSLSDPIFSDTWAYDYNTNIWTKMESQNDPSERMYFGMTYDQSNDKVVLWGGRKLEPILDNKIWTYDFNNDIWESHTVKGGPEKPLAYTSMVYRDKSKDILIYGGGDLASPFVGKVTNVTWLYNLKENMWENISPVNNPPGLANHSLAYDRLNNRVILFGGELNGLYSNIISSETWILISSEKNWIKNE